MLIFGDCQSISTKPNEGSTWNPGSAIPGCPEQGKLIQGGHGIVAVHLMIMNHGEEVPSTSTHNAMPVLVALPLLAKKNKQKKRRKNAEIY